MVEVRVGDIEASLSWDDWERWVQQGRVPPDAQVRFEPVTGTDYVRADTLESYKDLVAAGSTTASAQRLSNAPPILTALLVGIQLRIWWFTFDSDIREWVGYEGVNFAPSVWEDGEGWRLFTSGFLHLDAGHVLLNMLWLAYAGSAIERTLGRLNLLTLYVGSVMGGALLSMLLKPETSSLGASGGVFGLIAAVTLFGFTHPDALPRTVRRFFGMAMLPYLVLMFASGLTSPNTDNWAHFGGLVTGLLLVLLLAPPSTGRAVTRNRVVAAAVGLLTLLLTFVPTFVGPSVQPLADHMVVRNNQPGNTVRVEEEVYPELMWDAPVAWRSRTLSSGLLGMASPARDARHRGVAAELAESDAPLSLAELRQRFIDRVERASPGAVVGEPEPVQLAGREALRTRFVVNDRVVDWTGTTRGLQYVQWVWEVDVEDEEHLAPLRDRLNDRVQWQPPYELIDARDRVQRLPSSVLAQRDLALAESRVGEPRAAVERLQAVLAENPTDVDTWTVLFDVLRHWPDTVADIDALYDRALASVPTGDMTATVAEQLVANDRSTEAVGLLELAWLQSPQSRPVRRALLRLERPTRIDRERMAPAWRLADERGRIDRDTALPEIPSPLTLELAMQEGRRIARVEGAACDLAAQELPFMSDDAAAERLLWLQQGVLPERIAPEDWDRLHRQLLRTSEGRAPSWMCEALRLRIAGHPVVAWVADAADDADEELDPDSESTEP